MLNMDIISAMILKVLMSLFAESRKFEQNNEIRSDLTAGVRSTIRITSRKPEDGVRFWFHWVTMGAGVVSVILVPKKRMKLHD